MSKEIIVKQYNDNLLEKYPCIFPANWYEVIKEVKDILDNCKGNNLRYEQNQEKYLPQEFIIAIEELDSKPTGLQMGEDGRGIYLKPKIEYEGKEWDKFEMEQLRDKLKDDYLNLIKSEAPTKIKKLILNSLKDQVDKCVENKFYQKAEDGEYVYNIIYAEMTKIIEMYIHKNENSSSQLPYKWVPEVMGRNGCFGGDASISAAMEHVLLQEMPICFKKLNINIRHKWYPNFGFKSEAPNQDVVTNLNHKLTILEARHTAQDDFINKLLMLQTTSIDKLLDAQNTFIDKLLNAVIRLNHNEYVDLSDLPSIPTASNFPGVTESLAGDSYHFGDNAEG